MSAIVAKPAIARRKANPTGTTHRVSIAVQTVGSRTQPRSTRRKKSKPGLFWGPFTNRRGGGGGGLFFKQATDSPFVSSNLCKICQSSLNFSKIVAQYSDFRYMSGITGEASLYAILLADFPSMASRREITSTTGRRYLGVRLVG